jgi:hypothetical protein
MYSSIATLALLLLNTLVAIASPARPYSHKSSWEPLTPIHLYPRQGNTSIFLPPHTHAILGGVVTSNSSIPPVDTTPLIHFYHITNNTWTTKAPMPRPLNHVNVAVVNGLIYVLGGLAETNDTKRAWRPVGDSWMYTPSTDTWSSLPPIPVGEERGSAAVGVSGEKVYLAAGMFQLELFENGKQESTNVVSIFTPQCVHGNRSQRRLRGSQRRGIMLVRRLWEGRCMFWVGGRVGRRMLGILFLYSIYAIWRRDGLRVVRICRRLGVACQQVPSAIRYT